MLSILDAVPYPWGNPDADELHRKLVEIRRQQGAELDAQKAKLDDGQINFRQAAGPLWKDILDLAARSGLTRQLVTVVHQQLNEESPIRPFLCALLNNQIG